MITHPIYAWAALSLCGLCSAAFDADGNDPANFEAAEQPEKPGDFRFLQTPITEPGVNGFVDHVRSRLKRTSGSLPEREEHAKDLALVLQRFVVNDKQRENPSDRDDSRLWLSDRTACRVMRLLGELKAAETAEIIGEYLLLPWDLDIERLQGANEHPTSWALFQIGDASLPCLRKKMATEGKQVPFRVALTAAYILGPRAEQEFDNWMNETDSAEQRARFSEFRGIFVATSQRAEREKLITTEEYRRVELEKQQRLLDKYLDQPTLFEILQMKDKLNQAEAEGRKGEQR